MKLHSVLPAAAALAGLAYIQTQPAQTVKVDNDLIAKVFKDLNQAVETLDEEDGTTTHLFQVGDVSVQLYQFPDARGTESLKLNAGWDLTKAPTLESINTFNSKHRFCHCYLDAEGDPYIVADIDLRGGVTQEAVKNFISRFRVTVPLFVREVVNAGGG